MSSLDNSVQVTFRGMSVAHETIGRTDAFLIRPRSTAYRVWETVNTLAVFLSCLVVPYQASFNSEPSILWVLVYIMDAIFLIDVVLQFYLAYYSEGSLITDPKQIRRRYLKGLFIVDVITLLPLEVFTFAAKSSLKWHQAMSLLRLNRLLRIHRLLQFFDVRENELGTSTAVMRVFKYAAFGSIMLHLTTCVWFSLACPNQAADDTTCSDHTWVIELNTGLDYADTGEKYVTSLYWATATATSTGYGDIHSTNMGEKAFSVLAMLVGISLFFGLILGGMASMLTNSDAKQARYEHRLQVIKKHLMEAGIEEKVCRSVVDYYEYLWTHNKGDSGSGMFCDLPVTFQAELSLSVNRKVLEMVCAVGTQTGPQAAELKAPLFHNVDSGFMRMLSLVIDPVFYLPGQIIASKGEIGHHMFYIHRGKAEILSERDNETVIATLSEGRIFGEVSLMYNLPRTASVRAAVPSVVLLLDRTDLNRVLKHYPDVAEKLYTAVEHRCDLANRKGSSGNTIIEMDDEEVLRCLRQNLEIPCEEIKEESTWRRLTNFVIPHNSWFATVWERLLIVDLLLICFIYTFLASFSVSLHSLGYGESSGMEVLLILTYIMDLILVVDLFLRFNMATPTVTNLGEIRRAYVRSPMFLVDLLAVLPLEVLCLLKDNHSRWHYLSFLRLNRLIKALRISRYFGDLEASLDYVIGRVRATKFIIYIVLTTHLSACVWFFEACYGETCKAESWAQHVLQTNSSGFGEYVACLYWAAATMSSTGYGDIHAHDSTSQLIAITVMIIGLLLYGYCLSSIAATLANTATPKVMFMARIKAVRDFMEEQKLNLPLIHRVENYLSMLWRLHRGELIPGSKKLMGDMPLKLQQDVCYEETRQFLEQVPIFMETDVNFLRMLSLKTVSYLFSPDDYIVYQGDMGREMYLVRRGLVEVIGDDGVTVVAVLGPGGYFGEVGLIFGESRLATVRAKTYCEILMLTKPDLDEVLSMFPIIARQIVEAGVDAEHLKKVRKIAMKTTREAMRRLSVKCAQENKRLSLLDSHKQKSVKESKRGSKVVPNKSSADVLGNGLANLQDEFQRPYNGLHPVTRLLACLLRRNTILPSSRFFRTWQWVSISIAAVVAFTISLQAAFLHTSTTLWVINYCFDLFYLVDVYVKFHVAFYGEHNVLVTHPLRTAKNYLRTNFPLDVVCGFPVDLIVLAVWPEHLGVLRILSIARLNRCFHLYKINQYFQFVEKSIGERTNLIRQMKFFLYMSLFTHMTACGWFMGACIGLEDGSHACTATSWAEIHGRNLGNQTLGNQYVTSLYWAAATSASVGYGDIHAYTAPEMLYSVFCMIIGIVFYGFIIASVAAGLANADAQRARYQERLSGIRQFLEEQDVNENLKERIVSYYLYLWLRNHGVDPSSLFEGLPQALQADVTLSLYKDIIEKVPLFEDTEIGFLKMLSMYIKPIYFLSKEYIVRKGDIGQEMYFIHRGVVEVVSEHEEPIIFDTMGAGRFFGEISIVFSCPRTASIRAQNNCDIYMLTKHDLDEVLQHYPQIKTKILDTAEERQRMVRERAAAFAKKKAEEDAAKKKAEEDAKRREEEGLGDEGDEDKDAAGKEVKRERAFTATGEPVEVIDDAPKPSCFARMRTRLTGFHAKLVAFVILPNSKLRFIEYVNTALIVLTSNLIMFMAAFQSSTEELKLYFLLFTYLAEFSFYTEIFLNFHVAHRDDIGDTVTDPRLIIQHYLRGRFPFDFVASFPVDLFALAAPAGKQLLALTFLRFWHLLRLLRFGQFFYFYSKRLNIDVFKVRMIKFFLYLVTVINFFACIWYMMACPAGECPTSDSWVVDHGMKGATTSYLYVTAVYWTVATMTSTGYGDIHADSNGEMVYASLVMITGKVIFGFILGNIASTLANAEIGRVNYEEKLGTVQAHMADQDIPQGLQDRVKNFYEYLWNKNKGVDQQNLFPDMPICMLGELCMDMNKEVLEKVPLFQDTDDLSFIRLLCTKCKPFQFHAGEYIVRKGDIGQEMIIIKNGLVEVVTEEETPEVIETLEKGSSFGEETLVYNSPRKESVRAVTHVSVFVLSKEDLDIVLGFYSDVAARVMQKATELYKPPCKTVN